MRPYSFETDTELDLQDAMLRVGGQRPLLIETLRLLCDQIDAEAEKLLNWIKTQQWSSVSTWAHKNMGLTGILGATNLNRLCEHLGKVAAEGQLEAAVEAVLRIQEKTAALRLEIPTDSQPPHSMH